MNKFDLRKIYKEKRQQLTNEQLENMSFDLANQLVNLAIWDKKFYHIFLPIEKFKEIDTSFILHVLMGKDKHIVVSKTNFETNNLTHYLLTDDSKISKNKWGIPEPDDGIEIDVKKLDVVFVPLLVADQHGHRVGYGKGYYDRFLSNCRPDVLKIGLSVFEPIASILDVNEFDLPLNILVMPEKVVFFGNDFSPDGSGTAPL